MPQRAFPFDAGAGAAVNESDWQKLGRAYLATGVITGRLDQLAVTASGAALSVSVATGQAQVEGFFYENDSALPLTIAAANATNPRIDTVVVRLDRTANTALLAVVTGTAAAVPVVPTLSATDTLFEMPLANVTVPAAAGVIVAGNVADRRVLSKNLTEAVGGGLIVLAETVLTVDTGVITFSAIPQTHRNLLLVVTTRSTAALGSDNLFVQFNGDAAANYDYQSLIASGSTVTAASATAVTVGLIGSAPGTTSGSGSNAGRSEVLIHDYARTSWFKAYTAKSTSPRTLAAGGIDIAQTGGDWRSFVAITSLTVRLSTGSLAAGAVATLYAMKAGA